MNFDIFRPSPIQQIHDIELEKYDVKVYIKREDLIHPLISGNKWRKLKYNLKEANKLECSSIVTFGGAYSNHIYAVAAAGKIFNFATKGIIRGEKSLPLNPTLSFAKECGMNIYYETRENYRKKEEIQYLSVVKEKFKNCYILPEGGTNEHALEGCAEVIDEIDIPFDIICTPCGSGGTLAGLSTRNVKTLGFCVLKGDGMLDSKIQSLLQAKKTNWTINYDYHFGGYAKFDQLLINFITRFKDIHNIQLEPIYTGKMMFGIYDLIKKGYFKKGESIIALHTGGLQALQSLQM